MRASGTSPDAQTDVAELWLANSRQATAEPASTQATARGGSSPVLKQWLGNAMQQVAHVGAIRRSVIGGGR